MDILEDFMVIRNRRVSYCIVSSLCFLRVETHTELYFRSTVELMVTLPTKTARMHMKEESVTSSIISSVGMIP